MMMVYWFAIGANGNYAVGSGDHELIEIKPLPLVSEADGRAWAQMTASYIARALNDRERLSRRTLREDDDE